MQISRRQFGSIAAMAASASILAWPAACVRRRYCDAPDG